MLASMVLLASQQQVQDNQTWLCLIVMLDSGSSRHFKLGCLQDLPTVGFVAVDCAVAVPLKSLQTAARPCAQHSLVESSSARSKVATCYPLAEPSMQASACIPGSVRTFTE